MKDHTTLLAWQEAEAVSLATIELGRAYWQAPVRHVFDQLHRASLSVQLNITEGYAFTDTPSYQRHLNIAYASATETGDCLGLLIKSRSIPPEVGQPVLDRCRRCQRLLLGLINRKKPKPIVGDVQK